MAVNFIIGSSGDLSNSLNVLLLFGLVVFCGTAGARIFQRLRIPQVVGCIVIGVIMGNSNLITRHTIETLEPFTMLALGFIGFMIGGELRSEVFKKYGRQFFILLFAQGLGAFFFTALVSGLLIWLTKKDLNLAISMGLVFGAIASATAPATTTNVLWEYKTRGPLTAAILAVVALDDALALVLYRASATAADAIMGLGNESLLITAGTLFAEIAGAVLLGFLAGVILYYLLKVIRLEDKILGFSIALLMLITGVSMMRGIDSILPAMVFGITIANLAPRQSKNTFNLVGKFSPPVYTAFFVLAGAYVEFAKIVPWVLVMVVAYTVSRAIGKIAGSWYGAKISGAPAAVRKYIGICLLPQAGVAIGLAILAGQKFNAEFGQMIVIIVMTSTFLMEVFGPMAVKVGIKKAGEVGMNVTEEDLIETYKVRDVMDFEPVKIPEGMPLPEILEVFSTSDSVYYPVVNRKAQVTGKITVAGIKEMFANRDFAGWLLACDISEPLIDKTTADSDLADVLERMSRFHLETISVVTNEENDELLGVLNYQAVYRKISAEVLHRRKAADEDALKMA